MKKFNGESYVEVKDHQYETHPTKNIILRKKKSINFSQISMSSSNWDTD